MNTRFLFLLIASILIASSVSAQFYFYGYPTYYGSAWNGGYYSSYYDGYYYYGYPTYYGNYYQGGFYDTVYAPSSSFYTNAYATSFYICDGTGCFYWYYADPLCYGPYCYDYYYWDYPYYGTATCSPGYKCIDPNTEAYQLSTCNILPDSQNACQYGCDRDSGRCRTQPEVRCEDLTLSTHSVFMDAGDITVESFFLQNNNPWYTFTLDNVYTNVDNTDEDKFSAEIDNFDQTAITYGGRADIDVELEAFPRETYTSGTGYLRTRGHFNDPERTECDIGDIGVKEYIVYIDGVEDNSTSCTNIYMTVNNVYLEAGESSLETFQIYNNNSHRFYIDNLYIEQFDPEFTATLIYQDSYINPGSTGNVEIDFEADPNAGDYNGAIAVRFEGHYDNGMECSYSTLGEYIINVYINGIPSPTALDCSDVRLRAEDQYLDPDQTIHPLMTIENNGVVPFTIESVNAYDYDSEYDTQAYSIIDPIINPQDSGQVQLQVHGNYQGSGTAYYEVAGSFADGTRCAYNNISKAFYEVYVDTAPIDNCGKINISVREIRMGSNSIEYPVFKTENNSNKIFYVDSVYAYDYDADAEVEEYVFDNIVYPNSTGDIKVKVTSSSDTDNQATGYVELKGHFADGKACSNTYKAFNILIDQGLAPTDAHLSQPICSGYSLKTPSSMIIAGEKTKSMDVYSENNTGKSVLVRVTSSNNLNVTPESLTISQGLSTKHLVVTALGAGEGWITLGSEVSECDYSLKYTKVYVEASALQTSASITPGSQPVMPSPSIQPSAQSAVDIQLATSVNASSQGAELTATIKNNSSKDFSGSVELGLESGWLVEGDNDFFVKTGEEKKVNLTITAPEGTEGSTSTTIEVVDGQGNTVTEQDAMIPAPSTGMTAAMASLAANPLDMALIIILMVLLLAIIVRMMKA